MNTGQLIKELRKYLGLSLSTFGEKVGYSSSQITRFEQGICVVPEKLIDKICVVFDVNPMYFKGEAALSVHKISKEEKKQFIGDRLRSIRTERGLTLKKLSILSGVKDANICMIENGINLLTNNTATKLAEVLGVGVEWLLYGDESKKNFPADKKMIDWLWKHPEIREKLLLPPKKSAK